MRARRLPELQPRPDCIVLAGFAGALDPSIHIGDVIVDAPDECEISTQFIHGTIHGTDRIVATPAEKQSLFSTTRSMAVDMESAAVRSCAATAGVPLVIIRAISDAADQTLNNELLKLIDEYGAVSAGGILRGLARHPALTIDLLRLGRAARIAGKNLGKAVRQFIEMYARARTRLQPPA